MRFLLDTNAVIALLKAQPAFLERLRQYQPQDFALSAIVAHELFYGAYKSEHLDANLARVEGLQFEILEFDKEDARCAGQLRAHLSKAGTPIGPLDVLIAGQAISRSLVLITHNLKEFERIKGLKVEDWQ